MLRLPKQAFLNGLPRLLNEKRFESDVREIIGSFTSSLGGFDEATAVADHSTGSSTPFRFRRVRVS